MNLTATLLYSAVSLTVLIATVYFFFRVLSIPGKTIKSDTGWGSRIGLVLAMAGNAVGLGNFLRFPVQAINNGGGAFIIPYLVCFLLIGIPLLFVEWSMGRFGGTPYRTRPMGDHSMPFILQRVHAARWVKYIGVFGIFTNIAVAAYYCYIESWTMSYVFHSITGTFRGMSQEGVSSFFDLYVDLGHSTTGIPYEPVIFYVLCLVLNVYILSRGLERGVEKVAKIGMPLLIVFAMLLAIQTLSLQPGEKGAVHAGTDGLRYLWTPDFSSIWKPSVWIAAAGQIFFTLAVGMGTIQCFSSYLKKDDDTALNAMSAGWMNEFVEIVLGSAIIIPMAVGYLGVEGMTDIVKNLGGYGLGFKTLPYLFQQWGPLLATLAGMMWFGLLFFAGITSSLAMGTPVIGFLKDEFNIPFSRGAWIFGLITLIMGIPTVIFYKEGVFTEYDDWAGTYSLVIFAFAEIVLFAWIFGIDRAWEEITRGSDIRIPGVYKYIIKYVTPVLLGIILFSNIAAMIRRVMYPLNGYVSFAQLYLLGLFLFIAYWVHKAHRRRLGLDQL